MTVFCHLQSYHSPEPKSVVVAQYPRLIETNISRIKAHPANRVQSPSVQER